MASGWWFKRGGGNHLAHQQHNRQLTTSGLHNGKSSQKCHLRVGRLFFVLAAIHLLGLVLVFGWRSIRLASSTSNNNNNNNNNNNIQHDSPFISSRLDSSQHPWCHFEGHCPFGTTCVGHSSSPWGGICLPYRPATRSQLLQKEQQQKLSSNDDKLFDDCIAKCQLELEWDEHFYYDVLIPKFYNSMRATTVPSFQQNQNQLRPNGCMLVYERTPGRNEQLRTANREDWLQARSAQHVIRVDPLVEDTSNNMSSSPEGILWTALCYYPCQVDADCGNRNENENHDNAPVYFRCDKTRGVCDRNQDYWIPTNPQNNTRTVLVTGANSGYFHGLVNFAASARYWAPNNPLVVYNLGLSEEQLKIVESWSNVIAIEWRNGIPYDPPHVHQLKVYAWKPLAMNESVHKYRNIFWLDAGATFTGPIDGLEHYLQRTGIFLVKGQDDNMFGRAFEGTFQYFHLDKGSFVGGPHFAGGIQGHLYPSRYIDSIVKPNAACALVAECITPRGASLGNHRFDQTTLTILAYGRYHKIPHHTEFLAASSNQLHPDLAQPNSMFMWTARQGCYFYANREANLNNNNNNNNNNNQQLAGGGAALARLDTTAWAHQNNEQQHLFLRRDFAKMINAAARGT